MLFFVVFQVLAEARLQAIKKAHMGPGYAPAEGNRSLSPSRLRRTGYDKDDLHGRTLVRGNPLSHNPEVEDGQYDSGGARRFWPALSPLRRGVARNEPASAFQTPAPPCNAGP